MTDWTEYRWDERTELATFTLRNGRKVVQHRPLEFGPSLHSYFADLLLWLRTQA